MENIRDKYEMACKAAADAQGVAAIADALRARGIDCEVWQTGGFCMVAAVPLTRSVSGDAVRYIGCTKEGAGVCDESSDDPATAYFPICDATTPDGIAEAVEKYLSGN